MFLVSYLQHFGEQRQKRNDSTQRGVSLSETIKGRGTLKKSFGPKEERVSELIIHLIRSSKLGKIAPAFQALVTKFPLFVG